MHLVADANRVIERLDDRIRRDARAVITTPCKARPVGQSMSFNGQRANEAHADPDAPDGGRLVDPTPAPASPSPTIGFVVP
jgi:hypothetical protein